MKNPTQLKERGQALVMIAVAAVVLFAFAALAIDGSIVFSDRRHAQNAADTAALDAALAKTRGADWQAEGLNRASSNTYANDADSTVTVILCTDPAATCTGLPTGANPSQYIQVKITSDVKLSLAQVIGWSQITNRVDAVARSIPGTTSPMFAGNAVVGLAPHDCKAVMYQGNADTNVIGSGIFVNSDCSNAAFFNNSSAAELTAPCINSVGGIQYNPDAINTGGCLNSGAVSYSYPPDNIVFPNVVCPPGEDRNGNTLGQGTYSGHFPPSGVTHLSGGIYCVNGDFRVNGGDTLTGDNVLIVMQSGDVVFNGGATINLSGIPGPQSETNQLGGLLFYVPMTNCPSTVTINGNSYSSFVGTILAPCSDISIDGTGDSGLSGQIIGYTVDLSGTSETTIIYNDLQNWDAPVPPKIELIQ